MKAAIIAPLPDIYKYGMGSRVHLALAHLFALPAYADYYRTHLKQQAYLGDLVILDNGAHELDRPLTMPELLDLAFSIKANEVVLPDVQQDGPSTVMMTRLALDWLHSPAGLAAYQRAGFPRFMFVPQGTTIAEWRDSAQELDELVAQIREEIKGPIPCIGIAKNHDEILPGGVWNLLSIVEDLKLDVEIHMLGWPKDLNVLGEIVRDFPRVRSIDSARPLVYAKAGRSCFSPLTMESNPYPGRDVEYFEDAIPENYHTLAKQNIAAFRSLAGETA